MCAEQNLCVAFVICEPPWGFTFRGPPKRLVAFYIFIIFLCVYIVSGALSVGKRQIILQARTGPEGSRTIRLPDFKTIGT